MDEPEGKTPGSTLTGFSHLAGIVRAIPAELFGNRIVVFLLMDRASRTPNLANELPVPDAFGRATQGNAVWGDTVAATCQHNEQLMVDGCGSTRLRRGSNKTSHTSMQSASLAASVDSSVVCYDDRGVVKAILSDAR